MGIETQSSAPGGSGPGPGAGTLPAQPWTGRATTELNPPVRRV